MTILCWKLLQSAEESTPGERFISQEVMRTMLFNYIECNDHCWCCHSACGGISPEQFPALRVVPRPYCASKRTLN